MLDVPGHDFQDIGGPIRKLSRCQPSSSGFWLRVGGHARSNNSLRECDFGSRSRRRGVRDGRTKTLGTVALVLGRAIYHGVGLGRARGGRSRVGGPDLKWLRGRKRSEGAAEDMGGEIVERVVQETNVAMQRWTAAIPSGFGSFDRSGGGNDVHANPSRRRVRMTWGSLVQGSFLTCNPIDAPRRSAMMELETQEGDAEIGRCHICALTFSSQEALSEHLRDAHGGREPLQGSW
jgi:hypothetical protein